MYGRLGNVDPKAAPRERLQVAASSPNRFLHKASLPIGLRSVDSLIKVKKDRTGARGKDLKFYTRKVDCELKRLKRIDSYDRTNSDLRADGKTHRTSPVHAAYDCNVLNGLTEFHSHTKFFASIAARERSLGNCLCVVARSRRKFFGAHPPILSRQSAAPNRSPTNVRTWPSAVLGQLGQQQGQLPPDLYLVVQEFASTRPIGREA